MGWELLSDEDFIGNTYNELKVIEFLYTTNKNRRVYLCECSCGNFTYKYKADVIRGRVKSCGHITPRDIGDKMRTHGLSKHPLYKVWVGMRERCYYKNHKTYDRYGGRGITVCDEWRHSIQTFYDWAISNGWERGLEIERNDNDKEYSPSNCNIVTHLINCQNQERQVKYDVGHGELLSAREVSIKFNIKYNTFKSRIRLGWGVLDAIKYMKGTKLRTIVKERRT